MTRLCDTDVAAHTTPGVYLEISEATAISGKPLQVNISKLDVNGGGHGHRIAGPKFGSSGSRLLKRILIDRPTADVISAYLKDAQ